MAKKVYVLKTNDGETQRFAARTIGAGFFKTELGEPLDVTITSEIYKGSKFTKSKIESEPDVVNVTRLVDGVEGKLLVRRVLHNRLTEGFPNGGYVGKTVRITVLPPPDGERYYLYDVQELLPLAPGEEVDEDDGNAKPAKKSKK